MEQKDRFFKGKGLSITEAGNYLKDRTKDIKQTVDEGMKGAKPSIATPEQRIKYLKYCISLMTRPQDRDSKTLLIMRAEGMSHKRIAFYSKVSIIEVVRLEKEALKKAKDAIARRRLHGVPILGGK